jgi:hypothetical protein
MMRRDILHVASRMEETTHLIDTMKERKEMKSYGKEDLEDDEGMTSDDKTRRNVHGSIHIPEWLSWSLSCSTCSS